MVVLVRVVVPNTGIEEPSRIHIAPIHLSALKDQLRFSKAWRSYLRGGDGRDARLGDLVTVTPGLGPQELQGLAVNLRKRAP